MEQYLSAKQAKDRLGISRQTLESWRKNGKIKAVKQEEGLRRPFLYPTSEIDRLLQSNPKWKGKGLQTSHEQYPVSVCLPEQIDKLVRSLPNSSQFIREAVKEKLIDSGTSLLYIDYSSYGPLQKQPVNVKLAAQVDALVRSLPDPSSFMRDAIVAKCKSQKPHE